MLNSPGKRAGWAVTVQEVARALVTPRCSLAWSSPPRKSEWTKEPRGIRRMEGGQGFLPPSQAPQLASVQGKEQIAAALSSRYH